ncbi:hypothetical protein ACEW6Y_23720 (plasmid) [Salmonella enterica]
MSSALAGCMVKALAGGYIINALRRKKALIIAAVLILASAIGTALPQTSRHSAYSGSSEVWSRVSCTDRPGLYQ